MRAVQLYAIEARLSRPNSRISELTNHPRNVVFRCGTNAVSLARTPGDGRRHLRIRTEPAMKDLHDGGCTPLPQSRRQRRQSREEDVIEDSELAWPSLTVSR